MDFTPWDFSSFIQTFFRLVLSLIFFVSSFSKIRYPQHFITTIDSYELLSESWYKLSAFTIIASEIAVAMMLLVGWQSRLAAMIGFVILVVFSFAIGVNLVRRRTNLDCGCFGRKYTQKISFGLIVRNLALAVVAYFVMRSGGGLMSLDGYSSLQTRLLVAEMFLPFILVFVGMFVLVLLVLRLYRLLILITLEEK